MLEPTAEWGQERAPQLAATARSQNRRTIATIGLCLFSVVALLALTLRTAKNRSDECPKCEVNQDYVSAPLKLSETYSAGIAQWD